MNKYIRFWAHALRICNPELAILIVGFLVVLIQFIVNRCMWADSARVALNVVERSYDNLLRPLDYNQSAPVGFLWMERTFWLLFPKHDWSLKIVPFICHSAALVLFWLVLKHFVSDIRIRCVSLVVYISAIGPLYFSSEVKQYAVDEFAACFLIWATLAAEQSPKRFWMLAFGGLTLIPLSNATFFLLPTIILYLLSSVSRPILDRTTIQRLFWIGAVGVCWGGSLIAFMLAFTDPTLKESMLRYWSNADPAFLFRQSSLKLSLFTIVRQTMGMLAIFFGNILSMIIAICLIPMGIVGIWISKNRNRLFLLVLPVLFQMIASIAKQYPFAPRLLLHIFPCMVIVMAVGVSATRRKWLRRSFSISAACQICILACVFPLSRHETTKTIQHLAGKYQGQRISIDQSAVWNWRFYGRHSSSVPALMINNSVEWDRNGGISGRQLKLDHAECPLPSCPFLAEERWWLISDYSSSVNIIPNVRINQPLYFLFRRNNKKINSVGLSFQTLEQATVSHMKQFHHCTVEDEIHCPGSSAYLFHNTSIGLSSPTEQNVKNNQETMPLSCKQTQQ